MKESIVLYPAPAFAHMVSMVELGKLILHHHPHFSIKILVPSMPSVSTTTISTYINHISLTNAQISFSSLPHPIQQDQQEQKEQDGSNHLSSIEIIRLNVPIVVHALQTMSLTSTILALITSAVHTPYQCQDTHGHLIPTYNYFTSCASALAAFLYLPTIHNQTTKSFKELANTELHIPGLPPTIKGCHMPQPLLDRNNEAYHFFLTFAASLPKSEGIILNTFDSLEPTAIKAIGSTDGATPPLYCIGPLVAEAKDRAIASNNGSSSPSSHCLSLSWLDEQPRQSVVFLCFGSRGAFSAAQLREIAIGLERSDQRFLWVVRSQTDVVPDLEEVLPLGFMERTKRRGLVVKPWAPQACILRHESIGGFVTHCGWNSVVEAVSAGVPMIAWPLYAEQCLNSLVLVEEMKLAIPINTTSYLCSKEEEKEGLVSAMDVERQVRELMGGERGQDMRVRSLEMKEMAMAAWKNGGSSLSSFSNLVASWKQA